MLYDEELRDLFVWIVEYRKLIWTGHEGSTWGGETRNAYRIFVENLLENGHLQDREGEGKIKWSWNLEEEGTKADIYFV